MTRRRPKKQRHVIFESPDVGGLTWHLAVGPVIVESFWCRKAAERFCRKNRITFTVDS